MLTANQAFKVYLEKTNQSHLPKTVRDNMFKAWLQQQKAAGFFKDFNNATGSKDNIETTQTTTTSVDNPLPDAPKPFRPLGMHPAMATMVVVGATTLLIMGAVKLYEVINKQKS